MDKEIIKKKLEEKIESFIEALATLEPRLQRIIIRRFGLEDGEPKTLGEVGKDFGVTRERIRQMECKGLEKLKVSIPYHHTYPHFQQTEWNQEKAVLEEIRNNLHSLFLFNWQFNAYRCLCGKYARKRYLGVVCNRCQVVVQKSREIIKILQDAEEK